MRRKLKALAAVVPLVTVVTAVPAHASSAPWARGDWQKYVLSPATRSVPPVAVYSALARGGAVSNANGLVRADGKPTVLSLPSGDQSTSPLVILDFGKEVGGRVSVTVTGATAPSLHACFSESTTYMALSADQNNGESAYAPGCDTANIWNGYPGFSYTWDSDSHTITFDPSKLPATLTDGQDRGGFRYLTLFLSSPGTVDISKVRVDMTAAPDQASLRDYRGYFLSSSSLLNRIWYAGAYTVQLDTTAADTLKSWPYDTGEPDQADSEMPNTVPSQEVILDGAKRDRDVWQGDLSVEGPVTFLSTGDDAAWANSLASLAAQQVADGYVPAEGLVGAHNTGEEFSYGEYVMWFVNNMYQYWLYTGDRAFLTRWYPSMVRAVTWLGQQVDGTGLLSFGNSGSCGTYGYSACGHLTYTNAIYVQVLNQMASAARAQGQTSAGDGYAAQATSIANAVNAQLWNPTVGAYAMSTEQPATFPQDGNAMAVQTGVAPPAQARSALAYLQGHTWSTYGSLTAPAGAAGIPSYYAPLPSAMEVDARFDTGEDASAVGLMEKFWGYMLNAPFGPQSTFWEAVNAQGMPNIAQFTSLAHGWASGPTISLTQDVLGIAPAAPGYSQWTVAPHTSGLTWAEGSVSTPHGPLALRWQVSGGAFQAWLSAPRGTAGTVVVPVPVSGAAVRVNGHLVWDGTRYVPNPDVSGAAASGDGIRLTGVRPGSVHITTGD